MHYEINYRCDRCDKITTVYTPCILEINERCDVLHRDCKEKYTGIYNGEKFDVINSEGKSVIVDWKEIQHCRNPFIDCQDPDNNKNDSSP